MSSRSVRSNFDSHENNITCDLLKHVHPELSNSYKQVLHDLDDVTRLSYRGTANELREILREVLVTLAPDDEVVAQQWFITENNGEHRRPTQTQRARYILEKNGAASQVRNVAEQALNNIEEGISKLVRNVYSRSSVAAHTAQDLDEIKKQVMYFDALVSDLCQKR